MIDLAPPGGVALSAGGDESLGALADDDDDVEYVDEDDESDETGD